MMADMVEYGWAWVVCLGSCITTFFGVGTIKALGVLLPTLRQQFETQTWVIGLIISLVPGIGAVVCPLAGALSKVFSARSTVMVFSLLSSIGLMVASVSSSVPMLSVCFVLNGFSFGADAIVCGELTQYFDDQKFRVANSIYRAGASVGVIVLPLLTQFLADVYGWRGCMLVIAGLSLHCIISGAVLRTVKFRSYQNSSNSADDDEEDIANTLTTKTSKYGPSTGQNVYNSISLLVNYLDLDLFRDPNFLSRIVFSFGDGFCETGWYIYLVPFAIENGVSPYKAASLATVGGIGNLLFKGPFPFLAKHVYIEYILYSSAISSCLAYAFYPIFSAYHAYLGYMLCSVVFGAGTSIGELANLQIAKETIDPDKMTNAFMWIICFWSVGAVASGFLSGWIYDQTGSYTISFIILSAIALLSVSPQPFVDKRTPERAQYSALELSSQ